MSLTGNYSYQSIYRKGAILIIEFTARATLENLRSRRSIGVKLGLLVSDVAFGEASVLLFEAISDGNLLDNNAVSEVGRGS